ncbi:hypothetical protein [Bacillus sp. BF9-10]|uniref:hypothetical protein n=1 Tax=Bacillus sp. BF9-10 TaxID=2217822 RepID=UPI0015D2CD39|nr:hypothetical protein [Bacillus sp. BF9-10]
MASRIQLSLQIDKKIRPLAEQRAEELGFGRSMYIEQLIRADLKKAGKIEN